MCRTEWSSKALNTGQNWTFVHLIDREHTMTGRISPLRQRMIDDMSLRNMSALTSNRIYPGGHEVQQVFWQIAGQAFV